MIANIIERILLFIIRLSAVLLPSQKSMRLLLNLDNKLYQAISEAAVSYDNGLHPKHRLISYHDYFVKNIDKNENVLDIGCGNGALSCDIAQKTEGIIIGIDKSKDNIDYANKHYKHHKLKFVHGDVLLGLPDNKPEIDTIIMSNLLEHIEKRVEFLKTVLARIIHKI